MLEIIIIMSCRHLSLSFIASGRSSGLHPISSHSCCMYVRAGRPAFARPYAGVHRSTSLMSSSLLLQQCPACLVHLTWIAFVMGSRWPYSWCLLHVSADPFCNPHQVYKEMELFMQKNKNGVKHMRIFYGSLKF